MKDYKVIGALALIALFHCLSCRSDGMRQMAYAKAPVTLCGDGPESDSLTINRNKPFIRSYFSPILWEEPYQIMVVSVKSVTNPRLEPMTFTVSIEHPNGTEKVGSFSLYPPDEPGIFRVTFSDRLPQLNQLTNAYVIIKHTGNDNQLLSEEASVLFDSIQWE